MGFLDRHERQYSCVELKEHDAHTPGAEEQANIGILKKLDNSIYSRSFFPFSSFLSSEKNISVDRQNLVPVIIVILLFLLVFIIP